MSNARAGRAGRDRSVYLTGPKAGQTRPSRRTRARWSENAWQARVRAEERALEQLVEELDEEEVEEASDEAEEQEAELDDAGAKRYYRLCTGYRESKTSATCYAVSGDGDAWWMNKLVAVKQADVESQRRVYKEGYPRQWESRYTVEEMERKARQSRQDYGKVFVEYRGLWYEAVEERTRA